MRNTARRWPGSGVRKKRLLSKLNQKLESILRSASYAAQVQEQWISIRNGRYVIPVRAEQKRTFGGVIHGSSSSGATVFMEPLATLELNNDLVRLQEDEFREVRRILVELTGQVAERADGLQHAVSICADLDLTFAKARFGRDFDCVRPCASADRRLGLVRARHPLLEDHLRRRGLQAVPISIEMGPNSYVLIVSGPNAGGKTVALKTVGLFALMNQSGVPLPAEEATVPVFDRILADIGDQQSIANELSTFSAHVLAIRSMLEAASSDSLILLDEIGTSTEPGEGAALARAVVEAFREIGAVTVATTHYNRLKLYAESTPSVANAAMEFNETTLEPTYRLLHGLAGSSSGLKIAERLGLTGPIVERARALQDAADVEAARYVDELRERVRVLEDRKRQFEDEQEHFKVWKQQEAERVQAQRREEVRRGERRVESIVRELSERARRELKSAGEESVRRFKRRLAQSEARAVSEVHRELEVERADSGTGPSVAPAEIKTGALVRIPSLGITGSVSAVMPGGVEVIAGNMHIRRPLDDIEFLGGAPVTLPKGVSFAFQPRLESHEIHLIGSHVDEALPRIDKFLDDAYLAQAGRVRIIHGSGMGVLRRAVAGFLKGHPHVAHFDPALPNEGGAGVTIVTLRD